MEVGVQTDTLTNKNIVLIKDVPAKKLRNPPIKRNIKNINGGVPDIQQRWRMWKGIDERNLLRNVYVQEDMIDKLNNVFGVKQSEIEKARETFDKGRGRMIMGTLTKEQMDNRASASRIGGNRMSALQGGLESARALVGWEGADFDALDRMSRASGRSVEEVFPFSSINWGDAPAPRISMSEVEASQSSRRPLVGARELAGLSSGNILDDRLRSIPEGRSFGERNINAVLGNMLSRTGIAGRPRDFRGVSPYQSGYSTPARAGSRTASGAETAVGSQTPRFGISEGMRSGARMNRGKK